MFKLQPKPTFWAKVPVSIPGESKPANIEVEFKHLGRESLKTFFETLDGKTDGEALSEIVCNWRGIDAEFSRDSFDELLSNYPSTAISLFTTYRQEVMEAKAKN